MGAEEDVVDTKLLQAMAMLLVVSSLEDIIARTGGTQLSKCTHVLSR